MNNLICSSAVIAFLANFTLSFAQQENINVEDIVKKAHEAYYYAGEDMKASVTMKLITKEGKERLYEFAMMRKNTGEGNQKYFLYFYKPQDVRRTAFMVWKYPDKDSDRWIFVPAINMVRRIAASDARSSFVGSDFTYEDISGRNLQADTHKLLKEERINQKECYVVEYTPKTPIDYSKKTSWIDKKTFLPLKEEYTDLKGELWKIFQANEIKEITAGEGEKKKSYWTITNRTMEDVKSGHKTEVIFAKVEYGIGIEEELFTERNLQNPPQKWLK